MDDSTIATGWPDPATSDMAAITGVLLAGGRAERMGGQDKGLLSLAGAPLIAQGLRRLRPQVAELLISANRHLDRYGAFGYRVIGDPPDCRFRGPLAGILAAMGAARTPWILTAPCDSPFLPPDYAARMWAARNRFGATLSVARNAAGWQPVFALLPVTLYEDLRSWLAQGHGGVGRWLQHYQPAPVDFADWPALFCNVNTPAELARLEAAFPQPPEPLLSDERPRRDG